MEIGGLLIKDRNKDTLLQAGVMAVKITDWFFRKEKADLSYIGLEDVNIYTHRTDSVWNYQFIADYFGGGKKTSSGSKKGIELNLKHIVLKNAVIREQDGWLGQNKMAVIRKLELTADEINFEKKRINASVLDIYEPKFYIANYPRNKPKTTGSDSVNTNSAPASWNTAGWVADIGSIIIRDGVFGNDKQNNRAVLDYFDGSHLLFTHIQGRFEKVNWRGDTIQMDANLTAKERSGLNVTSLKSHITAWPNTISFNDLLLRTPESEISNFLSFSFNDFNHDIADFIHSIRMNAMFTNTVISSNDLALFAPALSAWKRKIVVNGRFRGTVDNISCSNMNIKAGENTSLTGNLVITGLPAAKETFIDLNNAQLNTTYTDLVILVPDLKKVKGVRLSELGKIDYRGSFTGFPRDFVTYGTLQTSLGTVVTDLNLKLLPGTVPSYSGKVHTTGFNLARFTGNNKLGMLGFTGKVQGSGFKPEEINTDINGTVTRFDYGGYPYSDITINGKLAGKKFNGTINAKDPNLDADLSGIIDISGKRPYFDLESDIRTAKFKALKLLKDDYEVSGKIKVKFTGSTPDNFDGEAHLTNAAIVKDGEPVYFQQLDITSTTINGIKETRVVNNEFEGIISGRFTYGSLGNAFSYFLHQYYPNMFDAPGAFGRNQDFRFSVTTKNIQPFLLLVNKELSGFNNSTITGSVNTIANTAAFTAKIPEGGLKKYRVADLTLTGTGTLEKLEVNGSIGRLNINDSLQFNDTKFSISSASDESQFTLRSSGEANPLNDINISGKINTYNDGVMFTFNPSDFTVNGNKWVMEKNGELILRKDVVNAKDMKFTHGSQEIAIRSEPDDVGGHHNLVANVKNLDLADFAPLVLPKNRVQGKLNGDFIVHDPMGKLVVDMNNTTINDLWFDNDSVSVLSLSGNYNQQTGVISYKARSDDHNLKFSAEGIYRLKDSTGTPIYNKIMLSETDVAVAKRFIGGIFKNISGIATGELEIFGSAKKQFFTGDIVIKDTLSLTVNFTNVAYKIPKARLHFGASEIDFSSQYIYDTLQNRGYISRGYIYHDGFFKKMSFDIDMRSDTMLLLNTNRSLNKTFYGFAKGDVRMKLRGPDSDMRMDISVTNPADAKISLVTGVVGKTLGKAEFIEFKTLGREMTGGKTVPVSNLTVNMNLNITPKAEIKMIFDELAGDNITARGNGNLLLGITSRGDVTINGNFAVENGKYAFSLQSWIKKEFDIERGSSIGWTGDPYRAQINIDAAYIARDVNLKNFSSSLFENQTSSSTKTNLKVTAELRDELVKPKIKFRIGYAGDNSETKNVLMQSILNLLSNNEDELNRQVAFLILFDRLLPYEQNSTSAQNNNNNTVDYGINTISGLIAAEASKYFKSLLERIFGKGKGWDADIDFRTYSPGNLTLQTTAANKRASSDIKISKSWLDDRLTIKFTSNLDFGLGNAQNGQLSLAFLPNFQVEYKLNANGSVVATVFHRQVLDILQANEQRRLSTGAGVAWRKEGESISDILGVGNKKKKKAATIPPNK